MKQLDEAIFIHRIPYSESSVIATFYTKSNGFQKFLFKGGKKKSHQLYPLSISEIQYYARNESELWNLTDVEPITKQTIQFDPIKSTIAFFIADVLNMVLRGTQRDEELFQFLRSSILHLEDNEHLALFPGLFMIHLTKHLGVQPLIENNEANWFDLQAGTIGGYREFQSISSEGDHILFMKDILQGITSKHDLSKNERNDLLRVMIDYYKIHVPGFKEPGTYDIIKEILY